MITIKNDKQIELMRVSSRMVAENFEYIADFVKPGITTLELDKEVESFIVGKGAYPAFKGLYDFPGSACISIDEVVVHGIPGDRALAEGDIVGVDIGVLSGGFYGDAAQTLPVGAATHP